MAQTQLNKKDGVDGDYNLLLIGGGLLILAGLFYLISLTKLPPELPWLYSLPWGEQQLVPKSWFGLGLIFLFLIVLFNFFLMRIMKKRDEAVAKVIEGATLLLICLYLASFLRVILIMI